MNDKCHKLGFHKPMNGDNCSLQNESNQNPNPNNVAVAVNEESRVIEGPLDVPLLGSNTIHGPSAQKQ